jgi:hypothetical protein
MGEDCLAYCSVMLFGISSAAFSNSVSIMLAGW